MSARRCATTSSRASRAISTRSGRTLCVIASRPIRAPTIDVSHYLGYKRPFFGARAVELLGATNESTRLGAMLSIKEYGPETAAGMLDSFLTLPFEFVLTQSFAFSNRSEALSE